MASGTLIGTSLNRVDGRKKVTGAAKYASEFALDNVAHGVVVGSTIPSGKIVKIDSSAAEALPGVHLVLTRKNRGKLGKMPETLQDGGAVAESTPPLEEDTVRHVGEYVAMVVADSLEQARYAASLLKIEYTREDFALSPDEARDTAYKPEKANGEDVQVSRGDVKSALAKAEIKIDVSYETPVEHPCAMEPHATIARWDGDKLTVYNSTQWIMGDKTILQAAFGLKPDQVHVVNPFVGGMFGSKAFTGAHVLLTAIAAKKLGRPVKTSLSRTQVLVNVGHRPATQQRFELGATRDGQLQAMRHTLTTTTSVRDEFVESCNLTSRMLYSVPNYATTHELVRLNIMKPAWMRAPGEASCQFAQESAMDEMAYALKMDPIELRKRNCPEKNPQTGKPFSSKNLLKCYEQGAERFGWSKRTPEPKSMREGKTLIGYGMATATYPGYAMGATVKVRLIRSGAELNAEVITAGSDVGTGLYTMLTITVAEGLGLPVERVSCKLGDSEFPSCAVAGGSNLTASTAPTALEACKEIRRQLGELAGKNADGKTWKKKNGDQVQLKDGKIIAANAGNQALSIVELMKQSGKDVIEAESKSEPIMGQNDHYAFQSFGAQFVEVHVNPSIGRVRVARVVSVFDCGKIMSGKTARSQFIGGIVFGIGQGLMEELVFDTVHGQAANADLAGYLVPVHADVPHIDVSWLDIPDTNFNSIGCRGLGEIGITGVAAAIANAVYHATGVRIRSLPISPEKLLAAF